MTSFHEKHADVSLYMIGYCQEKIKIKFIKLPFVVSFRH